MVILGLDTTAKHCTVALVDPARILARKSEAIGRGHAERLAPMVQEVLNAAEKNVGDVERISICTGPGSFTGLRVALAFAKGLSLPRKIPVVGITSLEVWAHEFDPELTKKIVSVADVKRGQLCWSAFHCGRLIQEPITQENGPARVAIQALSPDRVIEDQVVNGAILAWLGHSANPETAPAIPYYSRPPDAKLPGGLVPPNIK